MNIKTEGLASKYLALPPNVGKAKAKMFEYVKERIWKRIQGWKEKLLSKAGKEF